MWWDPPNDCDLSSGDGNVLEIEGEMGRQLLNAFTPSILRGRPKSQALVHMLVIHGSQELTQFAAYISRACKGSLQQERLKPAVEILNGAIAFGVGFRNEDGFHAQPERQTNHAIE
jgi:hypothetical protein